MTADDERAAQRVRQRFLTEGISENEILGQELARHREAAEAASKAREAALVEALEAILDGTYVGKGDRPVSTRSRWGHYEARLYYKARAALTKEPDA